MNVGLLVAVLVVVVGGPVAFYLLARRSAQAARAKQARQAGGPQRGEDQEASPAQTIEQLARNYHRTDSLELLEACMRELMTSLGGGEVIVDANDSAVEWRGESDGHQARIRIAKRDATIEVKQDEDAADFTLVFDSSVKQEGEPPGWDADDEIRVFVGKAVFMEGKWRFLEDELRSFVALPAEDRAEITEGMRSCKMRYLHSRGGLATAHVYDVFRKPAYFEGTLVQALSAVTRLASCSGGRISDELPPMLNVNRRKCDYCSVTFVETATLTCPNCGAAVREG
jgi:hypothetical protein